MSVYAEGQFVQFRKFAAQHVGKAQGYILSAHLDADPPYYWISVPHDGEQAVEADDVLGLYAGEACSCMYETSSLMCAKHTQH